MAQEIRKIEFNLAETHAALDVLYHKTGHNLPKGTLVQIKNDGATSGRLLATFNDEAASVIAMRDKDMMTALLVFCQQKAIPVPKDGKKVVKAEGDKVVLLLKRG